MAKARRGPALFELMDDEGGAVAAPRTPRWWSSGRRSSPATQPTLRLSESSAAPVGSPGAAERLFEISGDRVRLSLTSVTAAGAIFLLLAIFTAAYIVGARSGDRAGFQRGYDAARAAALPAEADEITMARALPAAAHLLDPLKAANAPREEPKQRPAPVVTPATGWVKDLTYVVVQEFPAGAIQKAHDARQFLAQRGVPAEVVTVAGGVHLITAQGYNHKDPAQKKLAEQLLSKVRTIGAQYYAAGGGYKLEGYYKTLKRDSW